MFGGKGESPRLAADAADCTPADNIRQLVEWLRVEWISMKSLFTCKSNKMVLGPWVGMSQWWGPAIINYGWVQEALCMFSFQLDCWKIKSAVLQCFWSKTAWVWAMFPWICAMFPCIGATFKFPWISAIFAFIWLMPLAELASRFATSKYAGAAGEWKKITTAL